MPAFKDLSNRRFGKWLAVRRSASPGKTKWDCVCDCGTVREVIARNLLDGSSSSCGCHRFASVVDGKLRNRYHKAKKRCTNPSDPAYPRYGGRGIKFDLPPYPEFFQAMHPTYFEGATLERIDNNGPYSLDNLRWATMKEQSANTCNTRRLTVKGETKTLTQWAEHVGVSVATIFWRLNRGWEPERAIFSKPCRSRKS